MRHQSGLVAVAFLVLALPQNFWAQAPPERRSEPAASREGKQTADPAQVPEVDSTPVLPPVEPELGGGLDTIGSIYVERIVLEAGTVLSDRELAEILAPYQRRVVTIEELSALRRELTEAYIQRGFVNSGVVLPDQQIVAGVVVLREVRGELAQIRIIEDGRFNPGFLRGKVARFVDSPLRVQDLQEALELLQQEPSVERVNARLVPGRMPSQADLEVKVKAKPPLQLVLGTDNRRSVSTGGEQATLSVAYWSLAGLGDVLSLDLGLAEGRAAGTATYSLPVNSGDTRIAASFSLDDAQIVEAPFDRIDIRSKTRRTVLGLSHPWLRTSNHSLNSLIGIEQRQGKSTLLGIPFSFSPGERDGRGNTTALTVGLEWRTRSRSQVLIAGASVRQGLDLFKATINQQGPDGRFTVFQGQVQYARRFGLPGGELLVRELVQVAFDPLLGVEKIPIGGFNTVRGVRENRAVRDNGTATSIEWRVPLRGERPAGRPVDLSNLRIAPFFDYARTWDHREQPFRLQPLNLYSAGLGLLWSPFGGFRADVYWAHAFTDLDRPGNDLQDRGIHFSVQYRVPLP